MQVYKAFFKVAFKRLPSLIPYFIIFVFIAFVMTGNSESSADFASQSLSIAVIDNDNTDASRELKAHLLDGNKEKQLRSYDDEFVQDMIYHGNIDCFITIEEGFSDKLASGNTEGCIESVSSPSTFTAEYANSMINRYVTYAEMYVSTGSDPHEACKKASELTKESAKVEMAAKKSPLGNGLAYYCQYFAFIIICIIINGLTPILMRFFSLDIRRRIDVSALPLYRKNAALITVTGVCVCIVWVFIMALAQLRYGGFNTNRGMLLLLNSFVLTVVVTGMALVSAVLCKSLDSISSITNIISLGSCFLCGVFVPADLLGSGVLSAARFLPVYWYVNANNKICGLAGETYNVSKILDCIAVEALFAAAFFVVFAVLSKKKMRDTE